MTSKVFCQRILPPVVAIRVALVHAMSGLCRQFRRGNARVALIMMLGIVGCTASNDDFSRVILSGEVTFSEEPVLYGMIRFVPEKGSKLPVAAATIEAGRYIANNKGGIPVGTYRVEITGYRQPLDDNVSLETGNPQYLPEKYNRRSEMEFAVDSKTMPTLDFHLK